MQYKCLMSVATHEHDPNNTINNKEAEHEPRCHALHSGVPMFRAAPAAWIVLSPNAMNHASTWTASFGFLGCVCTFSTEDGRERC
jgi:hypothetical protein